MKKHLKVIGLCTSIAILSIVIWFGWLLVLYDRDSHGGERAYMNAVYQILLGSKIPGSEAHDQTVEYIRKKRKKEGRFLDKGIHFDGERAFMDAEYQVSLGPRLPGSQAHGQTVEYIYKELEEAGWQVELQESSAMGHEIVNVVGKRGSGRPLVIVGAHYDTRMVANNDTDLSKRSLPVPGANDGASGVAVLLELARVLPEEIDGQIWLVFFDAEDNGKIEGWDWILGSQAFVMELVEQPTSVVIVDMIGDMDLNIFLEKNSDPTIAASIWATASELGYQHVFIPEMKHSILDDHSPFLMYGIPAVLIIDFDYPYWHTTEDTLDKISLESLQVVGDTLLNWLFAQVKRFP